MGDYYAPDLVQTMVAVRRSSLADAMTSSVKKANSSILFSELLRKAFQSLGIFPWPVTVYI